METSRSDQLARWIEAFVAETSRERGVDEFVASVDAAILEEFPEIREDPILVTELHASTRSQFQVFLSMLGHETQELLLPPQAVDLAVTFARRGLELASLLKVYRIGAEAVWDYFTRVVSEIPADGPDRTEALVLLWSRGGTWINQAIEHLVGDYAAERDALQGGSMARRAEVVRALLNEAPIPVDQASRDLGYPLRGPHTALVLWSSLASSEQTIAELNRSASAIARGLGAKVLTVPAGRGEVWCWLATTELPQAERVRGALASAIADNSVIAALGTSSNGLSGFLQSHHEARAAQRYAASVAVSSRMIEYATVELSCLMDGHPPAVRAFISRELGELAGPGEAVDRIRETTAAFLDAGANVEQAASRLNIHKNTVRYRIGQAEELIGHPLSERRTEIGVALRCFDRYGPGTEFESAGPMVTSAQSRR